MRNTIVIFTLLTILAVGSAQVKTLTDVIASDPSFSTLSKLLQVTGLDYTLSQPTPYTVFAPNNTAFNALPPSTLKALLKLENLDLLRNILLYHVVPGAVYSSQLASYPNSTLVSAQGSTITLNARSPTNTLFAQVISLNDARVIKANIVASNGLVHSLDRVLLSDIWQFVSPFPNIYGLISQDPSLSTLTYALKATGLDQVLTLAGPSQLTLFAPTNAAFEDPVLAPLFNLNNRDALKQVLLYHVLGQPVFSTDLYNGLTAPTFSSGGATLTVRRTSFVGLSRSTVNDATILSADNYAFNGVYHTIDRVLLPYSFI